MKLPLKTITVTVCVALAAIFVYQTYWLYSLYISQKHEMETAVVEAMRISDYNEMVLRFARLRHGNQHGEVAFSTGYTVDKNEKMVSSETRTYYNRKDTDNIVIQKNGWSDTLTINRKNVGKKRQMNVYVRSQRNTGRQDTTASKSNKNEMFSEIIDDKNAVEDLLLLMQRGIHSGIDMLRNPDINVYDSLLTARLNERQIASRHRLELLEVRPDNGGKSSVDTIRVISTPDYTPSPDALTFDYHYSVSDHCFYRLYIEPIGKSVLKQMTGILAASAATLIILAFAFWYLIHTMLRQRSLDEMKDDFTHNMTHELKTPISVAYAANDALLNFSQGNDAAMREKYLRISQHQLQRLGAMVEQILSTSMERRKSFALKIETLDVENTINQIIEMQRLKTQKSLVITLDVTPHDLTIDADRQHFCQMISNICDNAIKYSKGDVRISISCRKDGEGNIVIAISDNGTGIAPSHIKHIFEKFYRVPNGNIHEVSGYGLGLYYVATMMRLHGGTVDVESEVDKGSTFTLKFLGKDNKKSWN